jgi:UDP-glucose 4-epimerase
VKVVVTGGVGLIDADVTTALAAAGNVREVVVVDDLSTGNIANLDGLDVRRHIVSVLDTAILDGLPLPVGLLFVADWFACHAAASNRAVGMQAA